MLTELEITLQQALSDFGLRELPEEFNADASGFVDGIALVTKLGGIQNYCKVANDGKGKISIKKDYGRPLRIIQIEKLYAVHKLDKRFEPRLRNDKEIIEFLRFSKYGIKNIESLLNDDGKTEEQIKHDRAIVDEYVKQYTLDSAKNTLAEENRCKELKEYSKRIKTKKNEEVTETKQKNRRAKKGDNK